VTTIALPHHPANPLPKSRADQQAATEMAVAKVIRLPVPKAERPDPFAKLTAARVIEQHRAGKLPESILLALLAGVGLQP